ncbi:MAG: PAS domain S-box protein, partial [Bacteroidales bacterium]|nr:PAS domain S-box protein [Bacteroidales bacterium]
MKRDIQMENRKEKPRESDPSPVFPASLKTLSDIPGLAFNSTNQLITLSNLETQQYIEVNQAFLDSTGYSKEEIVGKTSEDIQLYVDLIQSRKYMRLLSRLKKVSDLEIRLRMRSGEERTFLFSARTFFFGEDILLITYYNDISTLNNGYARAESEKILREIFDSMSSYAVILRRENDNRYFIIDFNYRAEDVEQFDRREMLGKEVG